MESKQFVELMPACGEVTDSYASSTVSRKRYSKIYYYFDTFEEQLLPGIPNGITLNQITTKLPWNALHILPLLSCGWRQAIRSHQVYDARVRSRSAEVVIVLNHIQTRDVHVISLYSMQEKISYKLPAIPGLGTGYPGGCPRSCQCVWLEGKIYVLGGVDDPLCDNGGSNKVYVLDLAGQRGWKECASMLEPRQKFGCGVLDGKIYVFGGIFHGKPVLGSEVYNPKVDTWSSIEPMETYRYDHHVTSLQVRKGLFVYGGKFFDPELVDEWNMYPENSSNDGQNLAVDADFFEDYIPDKDEWRAVLTPSGFNSFDAAFDRILVAQGKLFRVTPFAILGFERHEESWRHLHSCSFREFGPMDQVAVWPSAVMAVGEELLAIVQWHHKDKAEGGACLVQSKGFGSENKEIVWQKTQPSIVDFGDDWFTSLRYFMNPIQL